MQLEIKDHTAFHADQNIGKNTLFQQSSALPPVPTQVIVTYLRQTAEVLPDGNGGVELQPLRRRDAGHRRPAGQDAGRARPREALRDRRAQIEVQALKDAVHPADLDQRLHGRALAQGRPRLRRGLRLRQLAAVAGEDRDELTRRRRSSERSAPDPSGAAGCGRARPSQWRRSEHERRSPPSVSSCPKALAADRARRLGGRRAQAKRSSRRGVTSRRRGGRAAASSSRWRARASHRPSARACPRSPRAWRCCARATVSSPGATTRAASSMR